VEEALNHSEPSLYQDRTTGQTFPTAEALVNAYLVRFAERANKDIPALDANGYSQLKKGSASIGINVLEDHGVLLLLAPIMPVPKTNREALYRRLLELSFLTTSDAAFAIDHTRDEVYVRALRRLSGLDYEEFEDLVATVARVSDEWDDPLRAEFPT
jgi:Tir chaperone protein (CesT) family